MSGRRPARARRHALPPGATRAVRGGVNTDASEWYHSVSPDGRWLSFARSAPHRRGDIDRVPMAHLTDHGERRRVALARALLGQPDVLALDEPTNHLDVRTVEWLEDRLAQRPGALIVVTHDRSFLDKIATRMVTLGALEHALITFPGCALSGG